MSTSKPPLAFDVRLTIPYDRALDAVSAALQAEGFGILTRIDLKETFAAKLGVDFRPYTILGACNPNLAHRALSASPEVGLLLPCNVTVEDEGDGSVTVRITDPEVLFAMGGIEPDASVEGVVKDGHDRLARVAAALGSREKAP